jgi:hypothetical protein
MPRLGFSCCACAALAAGAFLLSAQGTEDTEKKGQQIVEQSIAALGGDRFLNMKTRSARGRVYSFFRDRTSGADIAHIYTEYLPTAPPNGLGLRERVVLGKKQDYSYLYLENQGWDVTFRGARLVEDESWERYKRTTENDILYLLKVRSKEPGLEFEYIGSEVHLSTHVEVVDIRDSQSRSIRVYFDHNTMLPVRESFNWWDPVAKSRSEEIAEYSKFRDIGDGVKWPYTIERSRNGYKSSQVFAENVQANEPPPPKTFELPPGAKVLK